MTKKDFELIAYVINNLQVYKGIHTTGNMSDGFKKMVAINFAKALSHTNPRFSEDRFIEACTKKDGSADD